MPGRQSSRNTGESAKHLAADRSQKPPPDEARKAVAGLPTIGALAVELQPPRSTPHRRVAPLPRARKTACRTAPVDRFRRRRPGQTTPRRNTPHTDGIDTLARRRSHRPPPPEAKT